MNSITRFICSKGIFFTLERRNSLPVTDNTWPLANATFWKRYMKDIDVRLPLGSNAHLLTNLFIAYIF